MSAKHPVSSLHLLSTGLLAALVSAPLAAQDVVGDCKDLPDRLQACAEYSCTFTHPFTGGSMTRNVKGMQGEHCLYHETMPNDGSMDCSFDAAGRDRFADFYRSSFAGNPPAENPLNTALGDGSCKISGY